MWHESRLKLEMTVNRRLSLEDAIHRAANYAKAEKEFAFLAKQRAAEKKPHANTWVRPASTENNPQRPNPQEVGP